jgi:hypothetical protein
MESAMKGKPSAFRFDSELQKALESEAERHNRTVSNFVECVLSDVVLGTTYLQQTVTTREVTKRIKRGAGGKE